MLNFHFRFGQEVKVKLRSPFCKYFLTINDLYNGAKIVNLPLAVEKIWFFKILNFDFRFGQKVKVKLGSLFYKYFWQPTICTMVERLWIYLLWLLRYDLFYMLYFHFMTSQLQYDIRYLYLNVNVKYLWSYKLVWTLQIRISQVSWQNSHPCAVCDLTRDYLRLHVHMEFSSACDSIEDYCLVLYVCTNDNYVWGKGRLRANWVYTIHTE